MAKTFKVHGSKQHKIKGVKLHTTASIASANRNIAKPQISNVGALQAPYPRMNWFPGPKY